MKLKKLELLNEDYEADPLLPSFQNKASYLFLHYYCLGLLIYTRLYCLTSLTCTTTSPVRVERTNLILFNKVLQLTI